MVTVKLTTDEVQMLLEAMSTVGWGAERYPGEPVAAKELKAANKLKDKLRQAMETRSVVA
jgi:hypothetical protein